jgi:hypothetical protein
MLEERVVLSTVSSITSNFNGTAIPANDSVWFSSVAKVQGVGSAPATVTVDHQTISFTANGVAYTLNVPDTVLTLTPGATTATTTFSAGAWHTSVPASFSGNVFLDGLSFQPAGGLPGGIKNVTWQGDFTTDTAGVKVNWQWAAGVYSQFSADQSTLGVKALDDNHFGPYLSSDHAGTPENFKTFVVGGATGGGGSNFTGSYSGTASVVPAVGGNASISGYVYFDATNAGVMEPGDFGIQGVVVELTGVDNLGHSVTMFATTDANGYYSFTGLQAGTYTIERPQPSLYNNGQSSVGTVNGTTDGLEQLNGAIAQIVLNSGDQGTQYDFAELFAGS